MNGRSATRTVDGTAAYDWQPIRWIPVQAMVEVCDASGFIVVARLTRVGDPLTFFGPKLQDQPTHWRWRDDLVQT